MSGCPAPGSVDYLWFVPSQPDSEYVNRSLKSANAECKQCSVKFYSPNYKTKNIRCWNCGRFCKYPFLNKYDPFKTPDWNGIVRGYS